MSALARLYVLIGSEDDRVALRAVKEVLDRTLGRPSQHEYRRSRRPDMDAALARAREKLVAALIEVPCRSQCDPRLERPKRRSSSPQQAAGHATEERPSRSDPGPDLGGPGIRVHDL
jgi:hypothetical protein